MPIGRKPFTISRVASDKDKIQASGKILRWLETAGTV